MKKLDNSYSDSVGEYQLLDYCMYLCRQEYIRNQGNDWIVVGATLKDTYLKRLK